jgi:hypothetical protein
MFKEYINNIIDKHQRDFGVDFDIYVRDEIEKGISNGVYAFQVIYNSYNKVHSIKNLNYSLLRSNLIGGNLLWSYDGGVRYQWSEVETLLFDLSIIRNIKLEKIIK